VVSFGIPHDVSISTHPDQFVEEAVRRPKEDEGERNRTEVSFVTHPDADLMETLRRSKEEEEMRKKTEATLLWEEQQRQLREEEQRRRDQEARQMRETEQPRVCNADVAPPPIATFIDVVATTGKEPPVFISTEKTPEVDIGDAYDRIGNLQDSVARLQAEQEQQESEQAQSQGFDTVLSKLHSLDRKLEMRQNEQRLLPSLSLRSQASAGEPTPALPAVLLASKESTPAGPFITTAAPTESAPAVITTAAPAAAAPAFITTAAPAAAAGDRGETIRTSHHTRSLVQSAPPTCCSGCSLM